MTISVLIDNNVWDILFKHQLDLGAELPKPEFSLGIAREGEFEIAPLKDSQPDKWAFIQKTISACTVVTDSYFGFYNDKYPAHMQREAGFDFGRFTSPEEDDFRAALHQKLAQRNRKKKIDPNPKTGLYDNEADLSLAVRSVHSVVLTCDKKRDPLLDAFELGGKVVFLKDFDPGTQTLSDAVRLAASR